MRLSLISTYDGRASELLSTLKIVSIAVSLAEDIRVLHTLEEFRRQQDVVDFLRLRSIPEGARTAVAFKLGVFKDVTQAGAVREQGPERCRIRRVVDVTHNRNVLQPLLSPFVVNLACSLCLPTPLLVRVFLSAETFAFEVIDEVLPSAMVFRSNAFTRSNRFSKLNDARRIAASGWGTPRDAVAMTRGQERLSA